MGGAAVILILVGLIGGGFTFSGSVMPIVGTTARVLCFIVGGLMLFFAIALAAWDLSPPGPTPSPVVTTSAPPIASFTGYILMPEGYDAQVFERPSLSSTVLTQLPKGSAVAIFCTIQGESVTSNGVTSSVWNSTPYGFIPDVNVNTGTNQPAMPSC
jgi:hypothetical protein